jgi:predicted ATP-grasp superfamily ATP-dependent carboligase
MEQAAGDFTQNLVPDQMAVPIVDVLEMVEIAENEGSANIFALRTSKLAAQKIHDHPAVPKRRQVIVCGFEAHLLASLDETIFQVQDALTDAEAGL